MPDYYQILDLSPGATREQIKKAYRRKVMECHPDKNASSEAQALFIRVTEAYEALMGLSKERLKNSRPRGYSDASGQTDHYAFYQHVYSQAAEDRRRAAKERVDRQTEKQFEEYRKSNEAFRQSWQYRVFQSVGHAMRMGILLTGIGFLLLAYLTFRIGNALAGYVVSFAFLLVGTAITFLLVRSYWNEYKKSKPDRQ
jgi:curved DNA-binding protein CbpA